MLLHDLLRASTSSQGYHKMTGAMRADDALHDLGGEALFGSVNYFTTLFGSPEDANWAWMLTGHHMSALFTVAGDRTAFTPMFTGSQPLQIPNGLYAGWQVLPRDAARAGELLAALSTDQQAAAIIGTSAPGDVVAGPGRQASLSSFQGLPASQMNDAQQRLLWLLVQEFVANADFDAAEAQLALVREGWDDTHFAWQGPPPDPAARFYFRVHGPRILIEYDVQEPLTSQGGHVHGSPATRPTTTAWTGWGCTIRSHPRYRVARVVPVAARAVPVVLRAALARRPRNTGLRADDLDQTPVVREFVRRRFGLLLGRGRCLNYLRRCRTVLQARAEGPRPARGRSRLASPACRSHLGFGFGSRAGLTGSQDAHQNENISCVARDGLTASGDSPHRREVIVWSSRRSTCLRSLAPAAWKATRPAPAAWLAACLSVLLFACAALPALGQQADDGHLAVQEYPVPAGSRPHDAVPDRFGGVWYSGQGNGTVGRLDPSTGEVQVVQVGPRSAPHGIIIGPDDAPWVTDGGLNAIVRVDPATLAVQVYPLPGAPANLNTATFDRRGVLWFTGQGGFLGRLDPAVGAVEQFQAPRGPGPYGISTAPDGTVYFASLAGSYLGRIDGDDGTATELDPPTPKAGVRRVWPDSSGRLWVAEYNAGQVGRYDPASGQWAEWRLPGDNPRAYAVYVDERDKVWLSDTAADTLVLFDPATESFTTVAISRPSNVAQLGGKPGEVWGAERARDHLVVVRYG